MPKIYGTLFSNPGDDDQPFVYLPTDGSKAEALTITQVPKEVQDVIVSQADTLNLVPLCVIVDTTT